MRAGRSGLLLDLYQLTMAQSYVAEGIHERPATFSLFARRLPAGWGYLVSAGLDDVLRYLEMLAFTDEDLAYLEWTGLFNGGFLGLLAELRFTGDVRAMREGTLFFPGEPVLEVRGPIVEAQLVETVVLQEIHFQSLIAGKAARCVDAARGRTLVDFSLRRTHRADAGLRVARSAYLAGFDSTSDVLAGKLYGIPISGTMAHSFVQSFEHELDAFRAYARAYPNRSVLLVDTYDTLAGVRRAALVGRELAERGHRLAGIRLDSGDLGRLARQARTILDEAGLPDAIVFASGGLGEHDIAALLDGGAPIDGFGVGGEVGTAADSPYLDMAYKLVEVGGRATLKLSTAKETLPGAKQVWRVVDEGAYGHDFVGIEGEDDLGEPLLVPVLSGGRRLEDEPLEAARERCREQRGLLPVEHRSLAATPYEVRLSDRLEALRERTQAAVQAQTGSSTDAAAT